jgi:hypothetical protein
LGAGRLLLQHRTPSVLPTEIFQTPKPPDSQSVSLKIFPPPQFSFQRPKRIAVTDLAKAANTTQAANFPQTVFSLHFAENRQSGKTGCQDTPADRALQLPNAPAFQPTRRNTLASGFKQNSFHRWTR